MKLSIKKYGAVEILIIINLIAFIPVLSAKYLGIDFFYTGLMNVFALGRVPGAPFFQFARWQLVTSMFIHGDIGHILLNMYGLYIFGKPFETIIGKIQFTLYYLITGALANLLSVLFFSIMQGQVVLIGASGAVFAVVLGFAVFYPDSKLYMFFAIPMKIKTAIIIFTIIEIGSQLFFNSNVAHITHVLGFLFGFIYLIIVYRKNAVRILFFEKREYYH